MQYRKARQDEVQEVAQKCAQMLLKIMPTFQRLLVI